MNDNVTKPVKSNNPGAPELLFQFPISSNFPSMFQIFFLSQNQDQSVEVVETGEIDFEEIIERLNVGESVFIKNKKLELLESRSKMNNEDKQKPGYFTGC